MFFSELILFCLGGGGYVLLELLWRGFSHPSMFFLGGLCFRLLGLFRRHLPPLLVPFAGAAAITALELATGLLLNRLLGLQVWDSAAQPGTLRGQSCPADSLLWIPVSAAGAALDGLLSRRFLPPRRRGTAP